MKDYNTETRNRADLVVWNTFMEVESVLGAGLSPSTFQLRKFAVRSHVHVAVLNALGNMNNLPQQDRRNKQVKHLQLEPS